ncbi:MATE family efflux transporter [Calditerrivibrio nitroreducens]
MINFTKKLEYHKIEAKRIFYIAFPIIIASVSHLLMGFTDNVMAGRYSSNDLAGVSVGSAIWLPLTLFFMAVLSSTTPLMSVEIGKDGGKSNGTIYKTALITAIITGVILFIILHLITIILKNFLVDNQTFNITRRYLMYVSFAIPGFLVFQVFRSVFESTGKTSAIMISSFIGMLLNIPLNYIFIYGKLGIPEMGGSGCGLATSISTYIMVFIIYFIIKKGNLIKNGNFSTSEVIKIVKLGLPLGISTFLEAFIFSFGSIILAPLGSLVVASHQIALNFISTIFMIPLSLGVAISVRISHRYGENKLMLSTIAWKTGLFIVIVISFFLSLLMYLFLDTIISLYTKDQHLIQLTRPLMILAISFHIIDAFQVAANNSLKGYHNTKYPMWVVFFSYWVMALPLSLIFIYHFNMGAFGFWLSLIVGIIMAAILLGYKLLKEYNFKNM